MATMAFTYNPPPHIPPPNTNNISHLTFPITVSLSFPAFRTTSYCALKTSSDGYSGGDLLRKPEAVQPEEEVGGVDFTATSFDENGDESWVDWEDKILEDTVPLVGFVRMILHSGK